MPKFRKATVGLIIRELDHLPNMSIHASIDSWSFLVTAIQEALRARNMPAACCDCLIEFNEDINKAIGDTPFDASLYLEENKDGL